MAENRRGKKEERKKKKPQDENIMSASATQGGHSKVLLVDPNSPGKWSLRWCIYVIFIYLIFLPLLGCSVHLWHIPHRYQWRYFKD